MQKLFSLHMLSEWIWPTCSLGKLEAKRVWEFYEICMNFFLFSSQALDLKAHRWQSFFSLNLCVCECMLTMTMVKKEIFPGPVEANVDWDFTSTDSVFEEGKSDKGESLKWKRKKSSKHLGTFFDRALYTNYTMK